MSDRDEFGAFLVGFLVGGLTGAVVALLMAPQSGEETRAIIKDKSIELRDKAQVTAEEALAKAEAAAAEARARAGNCDTRHDSRGKPHPYFPMQKLAKIMPRRSSLDTAPVMRPSAACAHRNSSATSSAPAARCCVSRAAAT